LKKTIAWIITGSAPDSLFAELQRIPAGDSAGMVKLLLDAEAKGWVKILGAVKGSPEDVAAIIQEHFDARVVSVRKPEKKLKLRRSPNGTKKRVE